MKTSDKNRPTQEYFVIVVHIRLGPTGDVLISDLKIADATQNQKHMSGMFGYMIHVYDPSRSAPFTSLTFVKVKSNRPPTNNTTVNPTLQKTSQKQP